jgi:hypothetical protein
MPVADSSQTQMRDALRNALVKAVPRQVARARRRAHRRRIVFALVVGLALVTTIVTFALPDQRADARIDVEQRDGKVYVQLLDFESRPDEIVRALANAGINATVELVPVGPSNVGRFIGSTTSDTAYFSSSDRFADGYRGFSINDDYKGQLSLELGRPAEAGETWRGAGNALARGEVLACRDLVGKTAAEAISAIHDVAASIRWFAVNDGNQVVVLAEPTGEYVNWRVIDALSIASNSAVIRITRDGSWPFLIERQPAIDPSCKGR